MPMTKTVLWTVPQGATYVAEVLFVDPDTGAAIDLGGYSARLQARVAVLDPDPPVYGTTSGAGGHLALDAAAGRVSWTIPAAVTAGFDFDIRVDIRSRKVPCAGVTKIEGVKPTGQQRRSREQACG